MENISIGFHATSEEICSFAYQAIKEYDLTVVASKISPTFEFRIFKQSNYQENIEYLNNSRFIILCTKVTQELSNEYNDFLMQNTDNLIIQLGESTAKFMKESTIGTRCQEAEKLKIWKNVIKIFKKQMYQGVWSVNPNNGSRSQCKNNYFSKNALNAYKSGVVMKAFAGWNEYQFVK